MIKYKIIQVTGNKNQIGEVDCEKFDDLYSALEYFHSINVLHEILKDWESASKISRQLLIDMDAFLEYDLVKYDTDDKYHNITLNKKLILFRDICE